MLTTSGFARLISKTVDKYVDEQLGSYPSLIGKLFTSVPHGGLPKHEISGSTGLGIAPEHKGTINFSSMEERGLAEGNWEHDSNGIEVEEDLVLKQQFPVIKGRSKFLVKSILDAREERACDMFVRGNTVLSTKSKDMTIFDSGALFRTTHTISTIDGCPTQSNLGTSALTADNLAATRRAMMAFKDDKNIPCSVNPSLLIVGGAAETRAAEIVGSDKKWDEMTNTMNWNKGFQYVVWRWIDRVNPYAWFVVDYQMMKDNLFLSLRFDKSIETQGEVKEGIRIEKDYNPRTKAVEYMADSMFMMYVGMEWRWGYMQNASSL